MLKVRQGSEKDVVEIRDVGSKGWFNRQLNIQGGRRVNELLEG